MVALATPRGRTFKSIGNVSGSYSYTIDGAENVLADHIEEVRKTFSRMSIGILKDTYGRYPAPELYNLRVNGSPNRPLEYVTLGFGGTYGSLGRERMLPGEPAKWQVEAISRAMGGNIDDLRAAYDAADTFLSVAPTGGWRDPARARAYRHGRWEDGLVVYENGALKSFGHTPLWKELDVTTVFTFYSTARHASVIEYIHEGKLLAGVYSMLKNRFGDRIRVQFGYRRPYLPTKNVGQLAQDPVPRKSTGGTFNPLEVPYLEFGLPASTVIGGYQKPGFNLRARNRWKQARNLRARGIVK